MRDNQCTIFGVDDGDVYGDLNRGNEMIDILTRAGIDFEVGAMSFNFNVYPCFITKSDKIFNLQGWWDMFNTGCQRFLLKVDRADNVWAHFFVGSYELASKQIGVLVESSLERFFEVKLGLFISNLPEDLTYEKDQYYEIFPC